MLGAAPLLQSRDRVMRQYGQAFGRRREELVTLAFVLDVDAAQRNIDHMTSELRRMGSVTIRPYCKTHNSPHLDRRQMDGDDAGKGKPSSTSRIRNPCSRFMASARPAAQAAGRALPAAGSRSACRRAETTQSPALAQALADQGNPGDAGEPYLMVNQREKACWPCHPFSQYLA